MTPDLKLIRVGTPSKSCWLLLQVIYFESRPYLKLKPPFLFNLSPSCSVSVLPSSDSSKIQIQLIVRTISAYL